MNLAGIEGVTPQKFRRTVASTINESAGVELASQLLGHADPAITIKHDIRRNDTVDGGERHRHTLVLRFE